jgi:hypothetical protein
MNSLENGPELIKTDTRGRMRITPERRQQLLAEFDRSGLSAPKFATLTGIKYQTLAAWLQRRKKQGVISPATPTKSSPAVQWLETVIEQAQSASTPASTALLVRLPSGAVVEVANLAQATLAGTVLRAWEKATC